MTATELLASKQAEIAALCRRYGVVRLSVFGSAVRDDWDVETSDFDFMAEFGAPPPGINLFEQQFGLQVELERLLGRKVDLVETKMLKWVIKHPVLTEVGLICEGEYNRVMDLRSIITIEPGKRGGRPCVRGMRITVADVLGWLAAGMSHADVIADFPELTEEDIRACLAFAAERETRTVTAA